MSKIGWKKHNFDKHVCGLVKNKALLNTITWLHVLDILNNI